MSIEKLDENVMMFGLPKPIYTINLPSEITEQIILDQFGKTSNINLRFNGKPIRIHEGKITYYRTDGGYARALISVLHEEDKKKKKEKQTKVEFDPDLKDIQFEEVEIEKSETDK